MLKNVLVCKLLFLSLSVWAKDSYLIAINGSPSYQRNYDSFEEDFVQIRSLYPKTHRRILNSDGASSRFLILEEESSFGVLDFFFLRDRSGNVNYRASQFSESISASKINIHSTVKEVSLKTPKKVTLIYGNHGLPEGPSALSEILTRPEIDRIDRTFSSEKTIVQRLHLHCFSGSMLEHNEKGLHISGAKSVYQLKDYFKENRCALADAGSTQYASTYNGISDYLKDNPSASLESIYRHLRSAPRDSDPILSSQLFLQEFARIKCTEKPTTEGGLCTENCEINLIQICQGLDQAKLAVNQKVTELKYWVDTYTTAFYDFSDQYIQQHHKDVYDNYVKSMNRYQNFLVCENIGIMKDVVESCPQDLNKEYAELSLGLKQYEELENRLWNEEKFNQAFVQAHPSIFTLDLLATEIINEHELTPGAGEVPAVARKYFRINEVNQWLSESRSSPAFQSLYLNFDLALNRFIPLLERHPSLLKLFQSLKDCESKPVGPIN